MRIKEVGVSVVDANELERILFRSQSTSTPCEVADSNSSCDDDDDDDDVIAKPLLAAVVFHDEEVVEIEVVDDDLW